MSLAPSPLAILICGLSKVAVVFARRDIEKTRDFRRVGVRNLSSAIILLFSFLQTDIEEHSTSIVMNGRAQKFPAELHTNHPLV